MKNPPRFLRTDLLVLAAALSLSLFLMLGQAVADEKTLPSAGNDVWGLKPLGPDIPSGPPGPAKVQRPLPDLFTETVDDGTPFLGSARDLESSLLVLGEASTARPAALHLQKYFQKITGISVPIVQEKDLHRTEKPEGGSQFSGPDGKPQTHIFWLGETFMARKNKVKADDLVQGGYRIATTPEGMVLIGNDDGDTGTFNAATSLLERLGVRWLWPGDLGTVLPAKEEFSLPKFEEKNEPALACRVVRSHVFSPGRSDLGLKWLEEDAKTYKGRYPDVSEWSRVQRLGGNTSILGGHSFNDWYERFGAEHPDWFALQPDGTRVQIGERARFCVSNFSLADEVAKDGLEFLAKNPPGAMIPLGPNDGGSTNFFCMCVECRKLDPVNGSPVKLLFAKGPERKDRFYDEYVSMTDRYVTFFNRVARKVREEKPDALLTTFAYSAYLNAPLGAPLDPAFTMGFVGLDYFNEALRQQDLERWDKWAARSSSLYLRPNALLYGWHFPCNYTKELAEDLAHCYQTGMVGADYDSNTNDWATRGLNYYVLARLLWNPGLDSETIVEDYCRAGFGPAAEPVKRYFDELAAATREDARTMGASQPGQEVREEEVEVKPPSKRDRTKAAFLAGYTEERLDRMKELLATARELAQGDETVLRRIEFLALGLEYARLQIATFQVEAGGGNSEVALQELLDFLRQTTTSQPLAINTAYLLWRQGYRFHILK